MTAPATTESAVASADSSRPNVDSAGNLLRDWRQRRGLSQLALSVDAEVSTRHLSFVESGRSGASRELLLRLAECLAMPLRERNRLLVAGGFAPLYAARQLDSPEMVHAKAALDAVIEGHRPFPALLVDRRWQLVTANAPALSLMEGVAPWLAEPPVNLMRLALHPDGLAPRILNFAEWRGHLLSRLKAEIMATASPDLIRLHEELVQLPSRGWTRASAQAASIAVPLVLRAKDGEVLTLLSTTTIFGTANDLTLAELMLECLFPADSATREYFMASAGASA